MKSYLRQIDNRWQNHLEELEDLRDSVSLRTYAQKNPLTEYKLEGYEIFDRMIDQIKSSVAKTGMVAVRDDYHVLGLHIAGLAELPSSVLQLSTPFQAP